MKTSKTHRMLTIICLLIALSLFASNGQAAPSFEPSEQESEWTWQNPLPQGNTLNAVWGSAPDNVFAVGTAGTIMHYDGSEWNKMNSGTKIYLSDIWGTGPNDIFAVGGYLGGNVADSIILHYDGNNWSEVYRSTSECLVGIWGSSSNDIFAVGNSWLGGTILHYDGSSWSTMSDTDKDLIDVWGISNSEVIAVGKNGAILRYDGSMWRTVTSNTTNDLSGIWGSSKSDIFAVGSDGTILHQDGSGWGDMNSGTADELNGIWGSGSGDVFAVGGDGLILHFDGNVWTAMNGSTTQRLSNVWGISNSVFVVGEYGTFMHYNGNTWSRISDEVTYVSLTNLSGVWGNNGSDIFAVGGEGTILHYDGTSWNEMHSGIDDSLYAVWGSSDSNVFAVGRNGMILHYNGNVWNRMNSGVDWHFTDVWGSSGTDVFVVGSSSDILHYDGSKWRVMSTGTDYYWRGIWGHGKDDVFAVSGGWSNPDGPYGIVLHHDGNRWSQMDSEISDSLTDVWGSNGSDVFAVGGEAWSVGVVTNIIVHYDGNEWHEMINGFGNPLNAVWGSGPNDVFAVGNNGTILHYDGTAWNKMNSGTTNGLGGIEGSGPNNVFAVGSSGTILQYAGKRYAISGYVRDTAGAPLSNVTISAETDITAATDFEGAYTLEDLLPGTYTLAVDKTSWAFDPPTRTVVLESDVIGQDFTGIDVSAVISEVEYLADDTDTRLNQMLNESRDVAEDGDYFATAKEEDQVELIADVIVGGAGVLAEGVDSVANAQDLMRMNFPGVVGRGWGHIIDLRKGNEVARDAFREAMLHPVTAANAKRAAKELFDGAHLYYVADMADTAADDLLSDALVKYNWQMGLQSDLALQNELYPANEDLVSVYVQDLGATTYHTMDHVPFMLPDTQATYIEDLTRRSQANIVIASTLENRALPLHLARNDREAEKDAWVKEFLIKYMIKKLAYLWGDGPAVLAVEALENAYKLYQNQQRLKEDIQMMHLAVEGMSGAATSENRVYLNTIHGMDNIVQGIEPQIARGEILSSTHISEGEYKFFDRWWWCEHTAYSDVDISNPTSYSTVYQGIADYKSTDILGGNYEPLVSEGVRSITGDGSDVLRIYYKRDDQGASPDEAQTYPIAKDASAINIALLGSTDTGTYYITNTATTWDPVRVDTSGTTRATAQNRQAATTVPYPIRTRVSVQDDDLTYYSDIWVDNPFTQTVNITLTQTLPTDVEVIASSAVSTSGDALEWYDSLSPQTTTRITYAFRYQGAAETVHYPEPRLTMTTLSATAQVTFTGGTESFTSLPPLSGVGIPPAEVVKGASASVPITVKNRLLTETVSGNVHIELVDFVEESLVYSDTRPVSLAGGSDQGISFTFNTADIALGDYLLVASVESNGGEEKIFTEYFTVQPIKIYLPLIMR